MNIPADLRYNSSHEWVRLEGDIATVGITDHAQAELTDVVFVELPAVGRAVDLGDPTAVVESVKAASDIYAPLSGESAGECGFSGVVLRQWPVSLSEAARRAF